MSSEMNSKYLGTKLVEIYDKPIHGQLFVVGDIHGCYSMLMQKLELLNFDFELDLLVAVGDLVDRGSESLKCLNLVYEPWFKSIRGNHEQMCIEGSLESVMIDIHKRNGGAWLYELPIEKQQEVVSLCRDLPIVLEIDYKNKKYGFVHADVDVNDWQMFKRSVQSDDYFTNPYQSAQQVALWHRGRICQDEYDEHNYKTVARVDEIYLGHSVVTVPVKLQNCFFIDTGAGFGPEMTIIQLG